jgi:hypothetical protein
LFSSRQDIGSRPERTGKIEVIALPDRRRAIESPVDPPPRY